jgi:hypothetical protein
VLPTAKARRIARETLDIYAPIAMRLGMNSVRMEFEDLGFTPCTPCAPGVSRRRGARRGATARAGGEDPHQIEGALAREGHEATVIGREKHLYSIYQKMRAKKKSFSEIMDIYAFRIVVDSVDSCYRVLGCIHSLYKPVPGEFKDYIAIPKANGYQSLHTVTMGMHGVPIEIQIRTQEMEDMANNGIAAHWLYKTDSGSANGSHARARQWVQGLLEMQQRAGNSLEFIENVKIDLFPDEIYVFTPKGTSWNCRAARRRWTLPTRCTRNWQQLRRLSHQPPPGTAVGTAAKRSDRRGDHRDRERARTPPGSTTRSPPRRAATSATFSSTRRAKMRLPWAGACSTSPCGRWGCPWRSWLGGAWPATSTVPASPALDDLLAELPRAGACPAWSRHSSPASSTRKARCRSRQRLTAGHSRHRGLHGQLRTLLPAPAG